MIDLRPDLLAVVLTILKQQIPNDEVRAFGSRVSWTAKEHSDLDLVIRGQRRLTLKKLAAIKEAFEESELPIRVDVLDWQAISESFRKVIEKKCEVIQGGRSETKEWARKTIGECAAAEPYSTQIGPFGKALMANEYTKSGVPVLRGVNVNHGRFHDDDFVFIDEETADRLSKFESFPGDVLLVHKGTLGQIGLMPEKRRFSRYIMGNSMMRVRCDRTKLLPEYLYYWLTSAEGQHYLFSRVSQVGVPQIQTPLTTLRQAVLPVPTLRKQHAITHILGTLDDKIELNQCMNETLEAMARALFKSWFVDFEPVRAKAEGRDTGLPEHIAKLFPDRFVDSELGEIPEGWEVVPFSETVEIVGGGTPKTAVAEYWDGDIPWFSVVDAPTGSDVWVIDTGKKISREGLENSATRILPIGTTIISARGTVGRIALVGTPMAMNQSCYGLRGISSRKSFFNYFAIQELISILQQRAHGSVFDTITRDTLEGVQVVLPQPSIIDAFEVLVGPALERIRNGLLQSRNLAVLRDTLLPRLIAGELRVEEAERFTGDVA